MCRFAVLAEAAANYRLQVVTVATEKTDGYRRFMDSAERFNLSVQVSARANDARTGEESPLRAHSGVGRRVKVVK